MFGHYVSLPVRHPVSMVSHSDLFRHSGFSICSFATALIAFRAFSGNSHTFQWFLGRCFDCCYPMATPFSHYNRSLVALQPALFLRLCRHLIFRLYVRSASSSSPQSLGCSSLFCLAIRPLSVLGCGLHHRICRFPSIRLCLWLCCGSIRLVHYVPHHLQLSPMPSLSVRLSGRLNFRLSLYCTTPIFSAVFVCLRPLLQAAVSCSFLSRLDLSQIDPT